MTGTVPTVGGIDVAPPDRCPLLGLAHQNQSGATGCHGGVLERAGQILFGLSGLEAHHGHPGPLFECFEFADESLPVAVQQGRRRDGAPSVEQELDQSELILDARDIPANTDAVHRRAAKADVLVQ
jgi:hypothetical protein